MPVVIAQIPRLLVPVVIAQVPRLLMAVVIAQLGGFQPGFPAPSLRLLCLGALGPGPLGAGPLGAGALLGIARETKTHRIARDCSGLLGIARDCSGLLGIAWAGWAGWAPQNELSVSLLLQLNCNSHNKNMSYSIMIKAH